MVFDSTCIIKSQMLGEGGFGAVFAGCIKEEVGAVELFINSTDELTCLVHLEYH